ncbi:MAG: hypothetical protein IPP13_00015 [Kouleothrix sp.]|nr:hypothetical protein [Kouleothrix sp.]
MGRPYELDPNTARIVRCLLLVSRAQCVLHLAGAVRTLRGELRDPDAATDGRSIFVNLNFFDTLTTAEQDAVLVHEVLHARLLHAAPRRRDPQLWNIAADIG